MSTNNSKDFSKNNCNNSTTVLGNQNRENSENPQAEIVTDFVQKDQNIVDAQENDSVEVVPPLSKVAAAAAATVAIESTTACASALVFESENVEEGQIGNSADVNQIVNQLSGLTFEQGKRLSSLNGAINKMNLAELRATLSKLKISTTGTKAVLCKRLKQHYKAETIKSKDRQPIKKADFDYICVLDFEATCLDDIDDFPHEIIEFPIVLLNCNTLEIEDEFHAYCRPIYNPKLSEFCTSLTGITQETVDKAKPFTEVLEDVLKWLEKNKLGTEFTYAFAADCDADFRDFMSIQCALSNIPRPRFSNRWINIKKHFSNAYKMRRNLAGMLRELHMIFEGSPHSGIDDARNITRVVVALLKDNISLKVNSHINDFRQGEYEKFQNDNLKRVDELQM